MAAESLVLDGLALNDEVTWIIEDGSFTFTPAKAQTQWLDAADADGQIPAEDEDRFSNAEFTFKLRLEPQADMDAALAGLGTLTDKLRGCKWPGLPLVWTPAGSTKSATWYVLRAEVDGQPIAVQGDDAGWFLNSPVRMIKLICRPFGYLAEVAGPAVTSSAAIIPLEVPDVGGDVEAECRILVTDMAGQVRAHAEWGRDDNHDPLDPQPYFYDINFAGKTLSAAILGLVTVAGEHVGSFRPELRVNATTDARFRIAYRSGDGPWQRTLFKSVPISGVDCEIHFDPITFSRVPMGAHSVEVKVEGYTEGATEVPVADHLLLMPASRYAAVRAPIAPIDSSSYAARDPFNQTAGALAGKALAEPGATNWAVVAGSDGGDYQVNATTDVAERTIVSDASLNAGQYESAGATNYAAVTVQVQADATLEDENVIGAIRQGVFARLVDVNNWVMAVREVAGQGNGPPSRRYSELVVLKRDGGGTPVELGRMAFATIQMTHAIVVSLTINAAGVWAASAWPDEGPIPQVPSLQGFDADFVTGGTHDDGRIGIYDAYTIADANTRAYDNFVAFAAPAPDFVIAANQSLELASERSIRENAAGNAWGNVVPLGARPYLKPAGDAGHVNRLAVKARRFDVEELPDSGIADSTKVETFITERVLYAPR